MKNIRRIINIIICLVMMLMVFTACSSQPAEEVAEEITTEETTETEMESETEPETELETEEPTIFADTLNEEERAMYDMLVDFASTALSPSSIRLTRWTKATLGDNVMELEYIIVTGENTLGGNTQNYAIVDPDTMTLNVVNDDEMERYLKSPETYLSATDVKTYDNDTVNKINIALKEHFESIGY